MTWRNDVDRSGSLVLFVFWISGYWYTKAVNKRSTPPGTCHRCWHPFPALSHGDLSINVFILKTRAFGPLVFLGLWVGMYLTCFSNIGILGLIMRIDWYQSQIYIPVLYSSTKSKIILSFRHSVPGLRRDILGRCFKYTTIKFKSSQRGWKSMLWSRRLGSCILDYSEQSISDKSQSLFNVPLYAL